MKPAISVVIGNYNGKKFLDKCLGSLKKQAFKNFETIIVDDGSQDGSAEYIRKNFKWVNLFPFEKNKGAVEALNYGIKMAKGKFVLLLDNDIWFDSALLKKLNDASLKHNNYDIFSAKIWDSDKIEFRKANPTYHHTINPFGYLIWTDFKKLDEIDVFAVGAGFTMYRKSVLDQPVFDPDYVTYGADILLCFKLAVKGCKALMVDSIINHLGGGTFKKVKFFAVFHSEKNRIMNVLVNYEGITLLKIFPLFVFSLVLHNLYSLPRIWYNLRAYFWVVSNLGKVLKKRKEIQNSRKARDSEILAKLSCKLFDERQAGAMKPFALLLNSISCLYFKIVGIKTIEHAETKEAN